MFLVIFHCVEIAGTSEETEVLFDEALKTQVCAAAAFASGVD